MDNVFFFRFPKNGSVFAVDFPETYFKVQQMVALPDNRAVWVMSRTRKDGGTLVAFVSGEERLARKNALIEARKIIEPGAILQWARWDDALIEAVEAAARTNAELTVELPRQELSRLIPSDNSALYALFSERALLHITLNTHPYSLVVMPAR